MRRVCDISTEQAEQVCWSSTKCYAIHSINSLSGANYKYLVKHDDLVGTVNYYIVPVFKSGLIGESKLVITEDFEE